MKSLIIKLINTTDSYSQLIARITLGVVIFPHGAQKILGIWGGNGIGPVIDSFSQWFGIPAFITILVALGEFLGGIMLILGLLSRIAAFSVTLIMIGAIYFVVNQHFFMNWYTQQRGEGFEFHLLAIGLSIIIIIGGAGKFSLDNLINNKLQ